MQALKQTTGFRRLSLINDSKLCQELIKNHQHKLLSELLLDLSFDELSEEGKGIVFSTLDLLFDNGIIDGSQDITVIKEVHGLFCALHENEELRTKILSTINSPFFQGKLSQNKHKVLRQIFGYDIESSEKSLCPKDAPREHTKYLPANLCEALRLPIYRRVNYFSHYFRSYGSEIDSVFGVLSRYAPYLEKMIDPESDFSERTFLLKRIVSTPTAELDSILLSIAKLLK